VFCALLATFIFCVGIIHLHFFRTFSWCRNAWRGSSILPPSPNLLLFFAMLLPPPHQTHLLYPLLLSPPHFSCRCPHSPPLMIWYSKKGRSNCFPQECSIWTTIFLVQVGWCAQSMHAPLAVLNESFLSDAFAGREGQTPPFKGQAHAAPALCKTTLVIQRGVTIFKF
jgi:hypothetical protein